MSVIQIICARACRVMLPSLHWRALPAQQLLQRLIASIESYSFLCLSSTAINKAQGTRLTSGCTATAAVLHQSHRSNWHQQQTLAHSALPLFSVQRLFSSSCSSMSAGSSISKKLINEPGSVVTDAIDGFLASHPHLRRLDGFPDIKVAALQCRLGMLQQCLQCCGLGRLFLQ
jgi:hypothetical protein